MVRPIAKEKIQFSRSLRKHPTVWEEKLWDHLKNRIQGYRFKRQLVIGPYIVDFCCFKKRLIIELNGAPHRRKTDKDRTDFLNNEGYTILTFWDREIESNINQVLGIIIQSLN